MADEALRQADMKKAKEVVKPVKPSAKPIQPEKTDKKAETKGKGKQEQKVEDKKAETANAKDDKKTETKADDKLAKEEKKEKVITKPKKQMDHASVYGRNLPISLKHSKYIGNFIKGKKVEAAIRDLQQVIKKKVAVPFKGEVAHKKGKGMMSGKYPVKASENFIILLKSLNANSNVNGLDTDKLMVKDVMANKAPDQMHRFGRMKFKRTHVKLIGVESKK